MVVGIDWSISSPAWTIITDSGKWQYHFFIDEKTLKRNLPFTEDNSFCYHIYPQYETQADRYIKLANILHQTVLDARRLSINFAETPLVYLEGYSYAAKGFVFNIAESTGVMKAILYEKEKIDPKIIPSSHWKSVHGLKGNSDKRTVIDYINDKWKMNLYELFAINRDRKNLGVITDIADSICIATCGEDE